MHIELKKFGRVLTSRPAGREAFAAVRPTLDPGAEAIEVDFSGIIALAPSWADEFFPALKKFYKNKKARLIFLPTDNQSVIETFKIIEETEKAK